MAQYVICVFITFFSLTQAQQFRADYRYNNQSDAFYKLHVNTASNSGALEVCSREGAQLMVVSSSVDLAQALSLLEQHPYLEQLWIKDVGRPFAFDNASDECRVLTKTRKVESELCFQRLPFICKVNTIDVYYDSECQVFGRDYVYKAEMNSCYRISKVAMTWDQANNECNAQGAHLVIINSKAENRLVLEIYKRDPDVKQVSSRWWWFYAGFKANDAREFRTVLDETLADAGYVNWERGEPNNAGGEEYCGVVFTRNGKFNDVNCSDKLVFICEKNMR